MIDWVFALFLLLKHFFFFLNNITLIPLPFELGKTLNTSSLNDILLLTFPNKTNIYGILL